MLDAVFDDGQDVSEPDVERDGALHKADRDLPRVGFEQAPWQSTENVVAGFHFPGCVEKDKMKELNFRKKKTCIPNYSAFLPAAIARRSISAPRNVGALWSIFSQLDLILQYWSIKEQF